MAKRRGGGKKGHRKGGTRRRHHKGGKQHRRRSRGGKGMPPAMKVGLISLGLGVAGLVATPLLTEEVSTWSPYVSAGMIGAGGLALSKGNIKKATPYLLVSGTAIGVTALARSGPVRKLVAKAEKIGPITKQLALTEGEGDENAVG